MKFSCEKALLSAAVAAASRAVAAKSSIPAMEGILIEAGERLRLTGYNLETGIQATVPAEILEKGSLVLSARLFGEIVRKMPDDMVVFSSSGYTVNIKCGLSEFNILGTDPEEFPELPSVDQQNGLVLSQPTMRSMISQTLFAVSDNESRPIHTGSLFDVDENGLTVVSVDGYRLALRREPIQERQSNACFSFVVPGSALSEVEKICSGEGTVTITQGARHVMFRAGDMVLVARRLEGEFLPYKNAIPRNNSIKVEVDTRSLLQSIDRVSLIISEKLKSPLRCVFGDGMVSITTRTSIGDAADQCPITGDGEGLEIGFNNKYLMDALKNAPADRLRLEFTSGVAPCVILPAEGEENFIYMVLPVRLKAN
ncbi:DNA polymerase III subunit beta [Pseudoflavonifractor sp. AF19-9AC]|uniref:DNA polymerase III subunit beta n=1 Tax=Pseudoflavonifractor sp. AF19-9AC TaxID=2292244 RepID=UPI000E4E94B7|nr:DNA polymerase III subunit beta [Pseudoflavonifractor sp. AF19-9AC]RHR10831.1 DNA polymerase III subunit beta [Pseudoflavonifractor sp. AF19-9AC]